MKEEVQLMHENCKPIFLDHCLDYFKVGMRVLEVGPALPTPTWYEQQVMERDAPRPSGDWPPHHCPWETVDVNPERGKGGKHGDVTHIGTHHTYPLIGNTYDLVFASMVIEHTPRPWDWFRELARVCKPGGHVIVIAPFVGPEHGDDYWRVLPKGLRVLAERANLGVIKAELFELEKGDWRGPDTVHVDSLLIARKA